jgi:exosortase
MPSTAKAVPVPSPPPPPPPSGRVAVVAGAVLLLAFIWSYWPSIGLLVNAWNTEPDYSHGFLVVPIALGILWYRREQFPWGRVRPAALGGIALVLLSVLARYLGVRVFLDAADGWSMMIWLAGVVVALGGWQVLRWSLPSLLLLWFMIPMPYRVEIAFRQPLQQLATKLSSATLVVLGYPAITEANTIRIGDLQFGVAEACSGLRIFVGIAALAFMYVVVVPRSWWIKSLLLLAVLPVTLIANSTRIVVTCLLQMHVSGEFAHTFSHDMAGYVMIPFAAALLGVVLWYLGRMLREEPLGDLKPYVRRAGAPA